MSAGHSPWGIDNLREDLQHKTKEQHEAMLDTCRDYAECFSTPSGMRVLENIRKMLNNQPTWNPDLDPRYGFYREGQNDILRHIENRINVIIKK